MPQMHKRGGDADIMLCPWWEGGMALLHCVGCVHLLTCWLCTLAGDKVTAGTVNCDGTVTVRAEHSGQQTVIADIVRMVEMAQVSP